MLFSVTRPQANTTVLQQSMQRLANQLSAEDAQTTSGLVRQHPHLSDYFAAIAAFMLALGKPQRDYGQLLQTVDVFSGLITPKQSCLRVASFAIAAGFVEQSFSLCVQIKKLKGQGGFCVDVSEGSSDVGHKLLEEVTSAFMNLSCDSLEFGLRLTKTGIMSLLLEDIEQMESVSDTVLVSLQHIF